MFQIPNILKDKKCAAFERLQEDRFQQEAQAYKKQTGGGNFLSGLGGFLNTVRGWSVFAWLVVRNAM